MQAQNKTNHDDKHEKGVRHSQTVSDEAKSPLNVDQKTAINDKPQLDHISKDAVNRDSSVVVEISRVVLNEEALESETNYNNNCAEGKDKDKQDGGQASEGLKRNQYSRQ